jgi:long-chain acyl-CoA synthetase
VNIADALDRNAMYFPENEALVDGPRRWSYEQFRQDADGFAQALKELGVTKGDRVCLFMGNSAEFAVTFYGILKVGAIAVSISSMSRMAEVEFMVNDCEAEVVVAGRDYMAEVPDRSSVPRVREVIAVSPEGEGLAAGADRDFWSLVRSHPGPFATVYTDRDDGAEIIYTSGTTGKPKGVVLTHGNVVSNTTSTFYECGMSRDDRLVCFLPMYHSFAQNFIFNASVRAGSTLVILPKFDIEATLRRMAEERVTRWYAVPTIYIMVLNQPGAEAAFEHVTYCFSAAATMPQEVIRQWFDRFGLKINEGYGLTESTPSACYNHTYRHKQGTVGTPIMNVEAQIWDAGGNVVPAGEVGEIVLKGPNIMKGYYNNPAATAEVLVNGWLKTGDVGFLDDEGYLTLVDRIKDMVNSAGLKIWPREVEEVLYTHEAIEECAVIGVPDPMYGESVKACIVLRSGATICADDVVVFCKQYLASYKAPKIVEFMAELPKSATGKILKTELRKMAKESSE